MRKLPDHRRRYLAGTAIQLVQAWPARARASFRPGLNQITARQGRARYVGGPPRKQTSPRTGSAATAELFFRTEGRAVRRNVSDSRKGVTMSDLSVPELEQLARFDEHWRVVLEGDDPLLVWELRKRGYLDALRRQPPLYRLSEKGWKALGVIR